MATDSLKRSVPNNDMLRFEISKDFIYSGFTDFTFIKITTIKK